MISIWGFYVNICCTCCCRIVSILNSCFGSVILESYQGGIYGSFMLICVCHLRFIIASYIIISIFPYIYTILYSNLAYILNPPHVLHSISTYINHIQCATPHDIFQYLLDPSVWYFLIDVFSTTWFRLNGYNYTIF